MASGASDDGADWCLCVMSGYHDVMKNKTRITKAHPLLCVPMVMAVGLALRLYGLGDESAWWDEYASLAFLDAPSLPLFLQHNRALDPATLPLYFVVQYYWAHWVSSSVFGLRLLGVGIGIATIPVAHALGARLYGRRAGYVAALCIALSPVHIHHSQGIRMYGLLILLSVASFWSLLRMLQRGRRSGWWLHGFCGMLLYWTHPFALLVPAAQGVWLLLHRRLYRAVLPGFIMMHGMLAFPVVVYILSIRFWPEDATSAWLAAPGMGAMLADLFFDDVIGFHWQLRLGDIGLQLGALRLLGDFALVAVIVACLAYWGYTAGRASATPVKRHTLLLACWLVLPPLILFVVSYLWRPCMFPRYTAHCAVAMYLLLGGAVQQLRDREWRWCAYCGLAGLFLFQWAVTLPGPQRTDWQSAARHIRDEAAPTDIVLVEDLLWRDVFVYNASRLDGAPLDAPVAAAANAALLAAQCALFLGATGGAGSGWAVIATDYFETAPPHEFERELTRQGLACEGPTTFPGIRRVYVYRVVARPDAPPPDTLAAVYGDAVAAAPQSPFAGYLAHDAMQAFAEVAHALARQGRAEPSLALLRQLFAVSPFAEEVYGSLARAIAEGRDTAPINDAIRALWDGYGYRENQRHERAREAFADAWAHDPRLHVAAMELGMELAALGRYAAAADPLEQAAATDAETAELVDNLVRAIRNGEDATRLFAAVTACRDGLIALSMGDLERATVLFEQALTDDPHLPRAQVMLGFIYAMDEQYDAAYDLFDAYLAHGAYHSPVAYTHLALIHLLRDEPEQALARARKAMALDPQFKQIAEGLIDALLVNEDYAAVARELERLENEGVRFPPVFAAYLQQRMRAAAGE